MKLLRYAKVSSITAWVLTVTLSASPAMAQDSRSSPKIASPDEEAVAAFSSVDASSTRQPVSTTQERDKTRKPESAAKTSNWILAALAAAGAIVVAVILISGNGSDEESKPGTVITAGTPTVTPPNQ